MLRVDFHPTAKKELLRIPKKIRLRIIDTLEELEQLNHPLQHHHVIKLSGQAEPLFRMRIGNYRAKFILRNGRQVFVTHVQHRQAGY